MEIQRYWSVIRKRLWMIALIAIVGCLAAGWYTSRHSQPSYQAVVKLMVYQKTEPEAGATATPDAAAINSSIQLIKTYKQLILTPRILNRVAEMYPDLHTTAGELGAKLGVSSASETQLMTVAVTDGSYPRAAKMANAVASVFQEQVKELLNLSNVFVIDWADPSEARGGAAPSTAKNVAIALVLTLMIGGGLAFLLEHMDDSVKDERDVRERLNMPLLSDIPRIGRRELAERDGSPASSLKTRRSSNVTLDA
ncbi:YveK family protein [Cohnella fermenti]|uniref:Lipopolysaccharide biosynthesis protein n=1 Tax=Cohnella fermenti TaxID=2565925 RepID=A0A4S4BGR0_9BACL|nr:Wzz/FepE/Etk N-terminal domain-containing protein [Cohnella fermenti]THF73655.1 lipopolysaccharide biosynthesis protein [Cohnella fermenti]